MSLQSSSQTSTALEALSSVVMGCIQDCFFVSNVRQHTLNAQGIEWQPKRGCGALRALWIEKTNCQVVIDKDRELVIEAGEVLFLGGQAEIKVSPVNPKAVGVLVYGEWEMPLWLEHMLIDRQQSIGVSHFPALSKAFWEDARLMAQTQNNQVSTHPIIQQAMVSVLRRGIEVFEQDIQKSRLARLLNHSRMGKWFHSDLQKHGPMTPIASAALSCNYSASGFSKSVLQTIAIPYADFINHWRMTWSLLRFVCQKRNVKAESDFWGYETESSFRKRFRSVTGITPGQARQLSTLAHLKETEKLFADSQFLAPLESHAPSSVSSGHSRQEWPTAMPFDSLTGLARPAYWMHEARKSLETAHRYGDKMAVAFIDLDHFKVVNERFGRETGDLLLKAVAERLQACLRSHDLMARQGGDQFVVLLGRLRSQEDAATVAQKMVLTLNTPFDLSDQTVVVSVSIGLVWFDGGPEDIDTLLRHADVAMNQTKAAGRNDWCFFRADMDQLATEKLLFENGLRQAIENNELVLQYQPQINCKTSEVVGAEVLVRWHHQELGLLTPDRWVPWVVENNQINVLSNWVLSQACQQWNAWNRMGLKAKLAVNISAIELLNPDFTVDLHHIVEKTKINPALLELEVNEMVLVKTRSDLINPLHKIAEMGVHISLDDFSTDYLSFEYLKQLPLHRIKIDRSFICDAPEDQEDEAMIKTTLTMAHALGVQVVAEGVERVPQRHFLQSQACDHIQGWLVARPMDATMFESWWQRHHA